MYAPTSFIIQDGPSRLGDEPHRTELCGGEVALALVFRHELVGVQSLAHADGHLVPPRVDQRALLPQLDVGRAAREHQRLLAYAGVLSTPLVVVVVGLSLGPGESDPLEPHLPALAALVDVAARVPP
eukprot:CAMPEP_0167798648 /NCGR_PEP_ID=MMETSP0111_2-20121227/16472_1 /TAXON_ID=91324 /ORGANISM="Lotharella globosa, Strain CCCM811" /LENGTH=126 /DNA_ID=CAMNT_0007693179 /DNA_START=98 /DNA_END=478 /DNA_ORIENTATION=-